MRIRDSRPFSGEAVIRGLTSYSLSAAVLLFGTVEGVLNLKPDRSSSSGGGAAAAVILREKRGNREKREI